MLLIEDRGSGHTSPWKYNRLSSAPLSASWTESDVPETKIHRIHAYPARFPAFLVHRAIDYAEAQGVRVGRIADVFCGSGTVAYEAATRNVEFWGCDVNPVATLIARAKSTKLDAADFLRLAEAISRRAENESSSPALSEQAISRLAPWYERSQFEQLAKLRNSILAEVGGSGPMALAFDCAFSAILKPVSRWRSRSIKPAKDPSKRSLSAAEAFATHCRLMSSAWLEAGSSPGPECEIVQGSVMKVSPPKVPVDLILTSPPYAMSYEYADLHQLSALWLGYADDHRELRTQSIGTSSKRANLTTAARDLNSVGMQIVFSLFERNRSLAQTAASYFLDMQKVVARCHDFLRPQGIAVFVVGNTRLHGVRIDNANHLVESLIEANFTNVRVVKRRLGYKPNTPFRLTNGRLSSLRTTTQLYSEEYIIMAQHQ